MSLTLEKHFVVLEYFPRSLKALKSCEIVHYRTIDYIKYPKIKIRHVIERNTVYNVQEIISLRSY